jgi:hypothetical protein
MEKVAKSKIKFGLPVMAHDLVGKIQMICLRGLGLDHFFHFGVMPFNLPKMQILVSAQ